MTLPPQPQRITAAGGVSTRQVSHDDVLADIAHGLQTPLAAIQAHLSLMNKKQPRNKNAKICNALAEDMSHMVRDIVRLARTDMAVRASVQEKIDMGTLVTSIIEYMGVLAQSKGIELSGNLEPHLFIVGARKQLEEVIMNLINNSIKYIDQSLHERNMIHVTVVGTDASCIVSIVDTGCGIATDELPHVFTRFYRTRAGAARAPGSGLGLAIAKKTIEAHGGTITIDSAPGRGTRVTCMLPLHEPRLPFLQCIRYDQPVLKDDDAVSELGVLGLVGDHDDRLPVPLMQFLHDLNDRLSRGAVEVGRRLVGKKDVGPLGDRSRN